MARTRVQGWLVRQTPTHAQLLIPQGQLLDDLETYHFKRDYLDSARPQAVLGTNALGRPYYLRPGRIPLARENGHYRLTFRLGN